MQRAPENNPIRLEHMLTHAQEACEVLDGRSWEAFRTNRLLCLAIDKLIEITGEAANNVTDGFQLRHPQIPWTPLIRMRHKLAHSYFKTDARVLWETVSFDLPSLVTDLQRILADERA